MYRVVLFPCVVCMMPGKFFTSNFSAAAFFIQNLQMQFIHFYLYIHRHTLHFAYIIAMGYKRL